MTTTAQRIPIPAHLIASCRACGEVYVKASNRQQVCQTCRDRHPLWPIADIVANHGAPLKTRTCGVDTCRASFQPRNAKALLCDACRACFGSRSPERINRSIAAADARRRAAGGGQHARTDDERADAPGSVSGARSEWRRPGRPPSRTAAARPVRDRAGQAGGRGAVGRPAQAAAVPAFAGHGTPEGDGGGEPEAESAALSEAIELDAAALDPFDDIETEAPPRRAPGRPARSTLRDPRYRQVKQPEGVAATSGAVSWWVGVGGDQFSQRARERHQEIRHTREAAAVKTPINIIGWSGASTMGVK